MYGTTFLVNAVESLTYRNNYQRILRQLTESLDDTFRANFNVKIRRLTFKYTIIIILMLLVHIITSCTVYGFSSRQMTSTIAYDKYIILRIYQYIIVADVIKAKLEILHDQVADINREGDPKVMIEKFMQFKQSYEHVLATTMLLNESTGYSLLSTVILIVFGLICVTFWVLLDLLKNLKVIAFSCEVMKIYKLCCINRFLF